MVLENNLLGAVITSKTKISILVRLFLNPATRAYLRELAREFGVSTNAVRTELSALAEHGVLLADKDGRSIFYRANPSHPLFPELSSAVRKMTGVDRLVESVVERLGGLEAAYLTGDYASGRDSGIIDVALIGKVDRDHLEDITTKTEAYIKRKIRPLVLTAAEFENLRERGSLGAVMQVWEQGDAARMPMEPR